jgi:hypothetical protein
MTSYLMKCIGLLLALFFATVGQMLLKPSANIIFVIIGTISILFAGGVLYASWGER